MRARLAGMMLPRGYKMPQEELTKREWLGIAVTGVLSFLFSFAMMNLGLFLFAACTSSPATSTLPTHVQTADEDRAIAVTFDVWRAAGRVIAAACPTAELTVRSSTPDTFRERCWAEPAGHCIEGKPCAASCLARVDGS